MCWYSLLSYFSRYLLSGILTTLVHFGTLMLVVFLTSIEPIKASVIGFCLAAIYNYIFQYYWAFKVSASHIQFFSRYLCLHVITLGFNIGLFWLFSEQFPQHFMVIQLYVSACIIVLNSLVNGHFIYTSIKISDAYDASRKPLISRQYLISFGRYFISGGLAVLVHFCTLILLIEVFAVYPVVASTVGFCLAVIFNYTAQYYWTFKVKGPHQKFLLRYLSVTAFTLMINAGLFWLTFNQLHLPYLVSQVFATGVVFLINFFINHHYTFNTKNVNPDATEPS